MKINKLRDQLISQITKLENGEISIDTAKEITRAAQTITETIRVEIIYSKSINTKPKIDFMEYQS
jgi:ubiquitin C-terminal hydrolase